MVSNLPPTLTHLTFILSHCCMQYRVSIFSYQLKLDYRLIRYIGLLIIISTSNNHTLLEAQFVRYVFHLLKIMVKRHIVVLYYSVFSCLISFRLVRSSAMLKTLSCFSFLHVAPVLHNILPSSSSF